MTEEEMELEMKGKVVKKKWGGCAMWKFMGQGLNPGHISDNTRSLSC